MVTMNPSPLQASQADDFSKTADSVVIVTIEDVNDNAPVFDQPSISLSILENSPVGFVVLMAKVTDADQVCVIRSVAQKPLKCNTHMVLNTMYTPASVPTA